jgi:hypothetical protein
MIWRELVYRPVGIVPSVLNCQRSSLYWQRGDIHSPGVWRFYNWKYYAYQWDEDRKSLFENCNPPASMWEQDVELHWTSKPTAEQKQLIAYGATELPVTINKETGTVTEHLIYQRQNAPTEILNPKHFVITGIRGISTMRTCKKFSNEVAEVIYSENRYIFDTRLSAAMPSSLEERDLKKFESIRHQLPGLRDKHGRPRSKQ